MINLQLAAVFLVDAIELILIFTLILGFSFRKGIRYYAAAIAVVICCVLVIFGLRDASNRIFFTLAAHVLMAVALFEGKITVVGELAVLVHFLIGIIDSLCTGIMMLFFHGQKLSDESIGDFKSISVGLGIVFLLMIVLLCYKKSETVRTYLNYFSFKKFLYYILYVIISVIVIGYSQIVVLDEDIVYRLRVLFIIGASLFSILIIVSCIMVDVLLLQKGKLNELIYENMRCIDVQTKQYYLLNKKQTELKKFRHDYNAHMQALQGLSEQAETEKLYRYIADMQEMRKFFDYINTNNVIGDAILNEFYEKGLEENIEIKAIGKFPDKLTLSESDLCIVLSNIVKNAYEATQKCDDNRKILISIGVCQDKVLITIKNPVEKEPTIIDGMIETSKGDKENHGIGLRNVFDVMKRNNGDFEIKCENKIVTTEILL
ncbi:Uncharacterised protein [uncultured Eubacterium sp.]|nr:Uncharacterised protein [uncultured Eubacterium sp.]